MKFKNFIARVNPQSRPKKVQHIWQPGVKYRMKEFSDIFTIKEVLSFGAFIRSTNPSIPGFDRMVVISTTGLPAYQDKCELV